MPGTSLCTVRTAVYNNESANKLAAAGISGDLFEFGFLCYRSHVNIAVYHLLLRLGSILSILKSYRRSGAGDSDSGFPNLKFEEFKASLK